MQGNLHDMSLADLIQHNCQDRKTAQLKLENGELYFKDGAVVHAWLGNLRGEEAVYEMLRMTQGRFTLDIGVEPPESNVFRSWSGLLLEGARRIDENETTQSPATASSDELSALLQRLSEQLNGYVASVITSVDGTTRSQHGFPSDSISAQISLLMKLVETSVSKLNAGNLQDELLTTKEMFLLIYYLPDKQHFLAIMSSRQNGNLGKLRLLARLYAEQAARLL
jgi:predicted regulator of Ras-like GTPase activity (Roadblock/LC7/MglB family)